MKLFQLCYLTAVLGTAAIAADARPPDGVDQTAAILGGAPGRDRVFCHFPHGSPNQAIEIPGFLPSTSVRLGDWKLISFYADHADGSDRFEVYNLREDLGETKNLAAVQPQRVHDLNALITAFLQDTAAVVPIRNPTYNPSPKAADGAAKGQAKKAKAKTPTPDLE